VTSKTPSDEKKLAAIETVRCLSCGAAYGKPAGGGTVTSNPGCPECGYVGWVLAEGAALTEEFEPHHSFVDPPRRRSA
jgi:hypothetical protein